MMSTRRNGISVQAELERRGLNDRDSTRALRGVRKSWFWTFLSPCSSHEDIFASYLKIMITDVTEITFWMGVCETYDLRLFLEAKV